MSSHLKTTLNASLEQTIVAPKTEGDASLERTVVASQEVMSSPISAPLGGPANLNERYQTLATLGEGGMGAVYRCQDLWLQRSVALKRLKTSSQEPSSAESHQVGLFIREARVMAQLNHPSIVPIYDLHLEGEPFFTMEELSGDTLDVSMSALNDADPCASFSLFDTLLRHLLSVCEAVEYAHSKGVLHRDLKPSNIIITAHGAARVIDWGLGRLSEPTQGDGSSGGDPQGDAQALDSLTTLTSPQVIEGLHMTLTGSVTGTPMYMSPEQARGEPLDERSDVFSLGIILYELLMGRSPHEREGQLPHPYALVTSLQREEPLPSLCSAKSARPHLYAPHLAVLCERAIALRREERLGSVRELTRALSEHLSGEVRRAEASAHLDQARALYPQWREALSALTTPQRSWERMLTPHSSAREEALRGELMHSLERAFSCDPSLWQVPLWRLSVQLQAIEAHWELTPKAQDVELAREGLEADLARLSDLRATLERDLLADRPWARPLVGELFESLSELSCGVRALRLCVCGQRDEASAGCSLTLERLPRIDTTVELELARDEHGLSSELLFERFGELDERGELLTETRTAQVGFYLARLSSQGLESRHTVEVAPYTPELLRAERLETLAERLDRVQQDSEAPLTFEREVTHTLTLPNTLARDARVALRAPCWLPYGDYRVGTHLPIYEAMPCERVTLGGCWFNDSPVTFSELKGLFNALYQARMTLGEERCDERLMLPSMTLPFGELSEVPFFELDPHATQGEAYRLSEAWRSVGYHEQSPAVWVTFYLALTYSTWRSWSDELLVELPYELEWEVAARGPDRRLFAWGDLCDERGSLNRLTTEGERIRRSRSREEALEATPQDVSPFGLIGVSGNVADLCWISSDERDLHRERLTAMIQQRRALIREGASDARLWESLLSSEAWRATRPIKGVTVDDGTPIERIFKVARGGTVVNMLERCATPYRFRTMVHKSFIDVGLRLCARPLSRHASNTTSR